MTEQKRVSHQDADLPAWLSGLLQLEDGYTAVRRDLRLKLGLARPLRIVPYRGYGTPDEVIIRGRVQENRRPDEPTSPRGRWRQLRRSYLRYATFEEPRAEVVVDWDGQQFRCRADEEGFLELSLRPPDSSAHGWQKIQLHLSDQPSVRAEAEVLVASPDARYVIVSDIDDTLIDVGVSNIWRRFRALFLREADQRMPFEGAPAFYRALARGTVDGSLNPLIFVSSSPYNLYELLEEFIRDHDVPRAPLLLRDWGLTRAGFAPGGGHGHKRRKIEELLRLFPHQRFVLIGDSSQEDAEHYHAIARDEPGRVRAVYIRMVGQREKRREEVVRLGAELERLGVAFCACAQTADAVDHAQHIGLVAPAAADSARAEVERLESEHGP